MSERVLDRVIDMADQLREQAWEADGSVGWAAPP